MSCGYVSFDMSWINVIWSCVFVCFLCLLCVRVSLSAGTAVRKIIIYLPKGGAWVAEGGYDLARRNPACCCFLLTTFPDLDSVRSFLVSPPAVFCEVPLQTSSIDPTVFELFTRAISILRKIL